MEYDVILYWPYIELPLLIRITGYDVKVNRPYKEFPVLIWITRNNVLSMSGLHKISSINTYYGIRCYIISALHTASIINTDYGK